MRAIDAIVEILKREGVEFLSCYPTSPLMEAAADAGIRPIVCRQERTGVHIADGFTRISNGKRIGVFTMQFGPGAENAFPGVATAFSDSVPILLMPMGHTRDRVQVPRFFHSVRTFDSVTKWVEELNVAGEVSNVMRRAFSLLKMGRPGPVMIEIPLDVVAEEVENPALQYKVVKPTRAAGDPREVAEAARVLVDARTPIIHAGQGVLYAEATDELIELAELIQAPVMTTLEGKSAFPENHPLSLGTGAMTMPRSVYHFVHRADVVFGVGCSLTRYIMHSNIPAGKVIIHATNDEWDINKDYSVDHPIIGDAKLVLGQFIEAVRDLLGKNPRQKDDAIAGEIKSVKEEWLNEWIPKLTSNEVPINPYRIIWELIRSVDPKEAIVTHDSGSPRDQLMPFYQATSPRSYIGWGRSHALGTGLGLIMGAKLAAPDKFCINFMGDAAFGMTGLDFETAVRCRIPILTIVLKNSIMAAETRTMARSHELYSTRNVGGNYADMAQAMGGYAERIEKPEQIAPAIQRARRKTEEGQAALLEFIVSEETSYSHKLGLFEIPAGLG